MTALRVLFIGGTGVITVGALMGMAAHLEAKGASVLDMTGMSQKNGSVTSHVKIAATPERLRAQRIATGEADLVLGCDMLTTGAADAISKMRPGRTLAIVNLHEQPTGTFETAARRLPAIAGMGFDVVYLPPIHPIGTTFRKGPNNSLDAGPDDVGAAEAAIGLGLIVLLFRAKEVVDVDEVRELRG